MVLPAVQLTLNTAWQEKLQTIPYHVMMGRALRTAFTARIEEDDEGFRCPIDDTRLQQLVVFLVDIQEELLAGVLQLVDADRRHHRARGRRGKTSYHVPG